MVKPLVLTAGGATWRAAPELVERGFLGSGGLRLEEWVAAGQARVVKNGPHCTVYRVILPGLDFHVKHYRLADARARMRTLLRPSKARSEYDRALAVAARGVPTLEPLAVGETATGGSYLLTRTLADAVPLTSFLETEFSALECRRQTRLRQNLAVALGRFLALLHDAGVTHHDLHPGNLLLRLDGDEARLYLIDLHAVRVGPPLDWPRRRANIVVLNRWFALRSHRTDRLRCWLAYDQARGTGAASALLCEERLNGSTTLPRARDLERRTLASNLSFWRSHDRRCLGGNRWFRRVSSEAAAGYVVADLAPDVVTPLLADPDEPFRRKGVRVLKDSRSSTVIEFGMPVGGEMRRVIYKRFAVTRWTDPWAALVRPTPALRSYVMGHGLRLRGLPTPRPLAVWHRRRFGLCHEGYLLAEKVPDAVELVAWVAGLELMPGGERRAALRGMIDQAARLIATLHQRRLSHRDLKAANLLTSSSAWFVSSRGAAERAPASDAPALPQLWFIDLVGVARCRHLSRARRVQNLTRLFASFLARSLLTRTDLLRFLRTYLGWGLHGRAGWKDWWRGIAAATRGKVRRNLRNGRPLG